ncbi:MAG: hypothetical protein U5J63_13230 [Fodinibius sp.]|nr:hypothetical protein [Fodinibius sp.]
MTNSISSFFREQLKRIQRGSTIPYTPYKDLLNLYIKLPVGNEENDYKSIQREFLEERKQEAFEKAYKEKKQETQKLKKKSILLRKKRVPTEI